MGAWDEAVAHWSTLATDEGASFDRELTIDAASLTPTVTWGTSPGMVTGIDSNVPALAADASEADRNNFNRALEYMDLKAGTPMQEIAVDRVFIGSCTNARIEDLRAAAKLVRGYHVSTSVKAMVVPGSQSVKAQAEQEGLDLVFKSGGLRLARAWLQHVPGHESRHSRARRTLCFDKQSKLRRPAGTRQPHASGLARDGGRGCHHRPLSPTCGNGSSRTSSAPEPTLDVEQMLASGGSR